ncbi:hypothetical protein V6N12_042134 [Hibiscus sabdariffa]|uniref:Uncharacterized protein n=1 Tax=Hibiscus sabdariffa TaxID=183260 RepID=A0ABR2EDW6_9ROSI
MEEGWFQATKMERTDQMEKMEHMVSENKEKWVELTQHSSKKNSKEEKEDRKEETASESSSAGRSQSMKSKGHSGEQNDEADSVNVKGVGRDATALGKNKIKNGIVNAGDSKEEIAKGEGKRSSGPSQSTKSENSKPSWAEIIKKNQCPIEGNGAQSLAAQRISEDAVNMGLGIKDVSVELDKNKSEDQVSVGSKEDNNPGGNIQQGHIREIDEEVSSEENIVSEYEEAFMGKTNVGRLSKNQKKKEQRFGSLSEIQDKIGFEIKGDVNEAIMDLVEIAERD